MKKLEANDFLFLIVFFSWLPSVDMDHLSILQYVGLEVAILWSVAFLLKFFVR